MNDKDKTFIFKPEKDGKEIIDRSDFDEYTAPRRSREQKEKEESGNILAYIAIGLAILLVIAIAVTFFIVKNRNNPPKHPEDDNIIIETDNEEEEPEEEEKEEVISSWGVSFDSDEIYHMESGNGYAVFSDFYRNNGKREYVKRKVYIDDETDIRDNGKRITTDAFIYIIKNQGGNLIIFDSEIEENSNKIISISYDSRGFEEEEPETVLEEKPEETPVENNEGTEIN